MIGIYYVFLVVISVPVYVLSTTFKEKKIKLEVPFAMQFFS